MLTLVSPNNKLHLSIQIFNLNLHFTNVQEVVVVVVVKMQNRKVEQDVQ